MSDPMKSRERKRPTRAQTRERLIEAARAVFAERAYEHASLDEIAAAAGLTKGAIYSNFGSKDELFYALMRDQIDERLRRITLASDPHTTIAGRVLAAGRTLADATAGEPEWHLAFIEFWARTMRNPGLREDFARHRQAARDTIAGYLETQAARAGVDLPLPARQLAVAVLALSNGLAIEQLTEPEYADPALLPTLLNLLLTANDSPAVGLSE
jgi:AcrR family transcriptional regulator